MFTCPDRLTSGLLPSPINWEPENAGLMLLTNVLFIIKILSCSFFLGTVWVSHSHVSSLQTLRPLNKSFIIYFKPTPCGSFTRSVDSGQGAESPNPGCKVRCPFMRLASAVQATGVKGHCIRESGTFRIGCPGRRWRFDGTWWGPQ